MPTLTPERTEQRIEITLLDEMFKQDATCQVNLVRGAVTPCGEHATHRMKCECLIEGEVVCYADILVCKMHLEMALAGKCVCSQHGIPVVVLAGHHPV